MLKAKFLFGNLAKDIATRTLHLAQRSMPHVSAWLQRATRCICRKAQPPPGGREMTTQRRVDNDNLL
jgi:hypothetical protein